MNKPRGFYDRRQEAAGGCRRLQEAAGGEGCRRRRHRMRRLQEAGGRILQEAAGGCRRLQEAAGGGGCRRRILQEDEAGGYSPPLNPPPRFLASLPGKNLHLDAFSSRSCPI